MTKRILSGIQPTGKIHLGNYLGAIRNWLVMEKDYDCLFCIVDLHALTLPQSPFELRQNTRTVAAVYIATGINPEKSIIFNQSQVPAHAELTWLLSCLTPMGWLNRMTQFKDKAGKQKDSANLGLYAYPVLMAADILLYQATHVPVGEDQKQHLELARDIAGVFNRVYETNFFSLPEPQIFGTATRVMSLRDGLVKMSKSDLSEYSRIHLMDDPDTITLKIRKAKTDLEPLPSTYLELQNRPEACNLVNIYAALQNMIPDEVCNRYAGKTFSIFKKDLTEILVTALSPIARESKRLLQDLSYIDRLLAEGNTKASLIAQKTIQEVQELIGILRP